MGDSSQINTYGRQLTEDELQSKAHREAVGGAWDEIGLPRRGIGSDGLLVLLAACARQQGSEAPGRAVSDLREHGAILHGRLLSAFPARRLARRESHRARTAWSRGQSGAQ